LPATLERLNEGERREVGKIIGTDTGVVERILASPPPRVVRRPEDMRLRTPVDFPPGLVADLLAISGCRNMGGGDWPWGRVKYDETGAVGEIGLPPFEGRGSCGRVARALVLLAIEPADRLAKPSSSDVLTIPTDHELLECLAADQPRLLSPFSFDDEQQHSGGKPVRRKFPSSDVRLTANRVVAFFDVEVGATGCVRGIEMMASDRLDQIALLKTIAAWRWEPLRLAGRPTSFRTNIFINFLRTVRVQPQPPTFRPPR
jgi:hypothetical protein